MRIEQSISELLYAKRQVAAESRIDKAYDTAIKSLDSWDKLEEQLEIMMEGDKRTLSNPITEDGLFYEGVYYSLKLVKQFIQVIEK